MTAPVEHLFRGGERIRREDVPAAVLAELRRRVVGDGHRGVSVHDGPVLYSLVIRDADDVAPVPHLHRTRSAGCASCDAGVPYLPTVEAAREWAERSSRFSVVRDDVLR